MRSNISRFLAMRNAAGIVIGSLMFASCATVGPDFEPPVADIEVAWQRAEASGVSKNPMELIEWWQVFEDPTLNELIQIAYEKNKNLEIAGLRVLEARAQLGIAIGGRYPQVQQGSGGATYTARSRNAPNTTGGDMRYWQYDIGADVSWELDFWGRFQRGIESADASLLASIANYDNVLVLLAAQVADTYVLIRTTEQQLRVSRENVKLQERSVEITDVRFRHGDKDELDLQQAKSQLLSTEATIPQLEQTLYQAHNALSTLLGRPPGDLSDLLGQGKIPGIPSEINAGIPAELLRRRPDVRQAELNAAAQSARIGIAVADLYPSFSLGGSLSLVAADGTDATRTGDSGAGEIVGSDSIAFTGGPSFRWSFLNYGRIRNNIRVQDARLQQLLVTYENTVLNAAREVEDAMVAFSSNVKESGILSESVDASRRSVDLSTLRYREGYSDFQRVLDAQGSLFSQSQRYVSSQGATASSIVSLYRALGGGWQYRVGREFVNEDNKRQMRDRVDWGELLESGAAEPPGLGDPEADRDIDW